MLITSSGFGFEIEVTAKVAKLRCAVYEVPISYYGRTYAEGKKVGFTDGLAAAWFIVRFNLFCGTAASFRRMPKLGGAYKPAREAETAETAETTDADRKSTRLNSSHANISYAV